ncbi:acyl-CoA binding protein [Angomonas deanei]|uniref:Acyl CoA binding protein, putative n=1 Tax=Angomonas deanei TaxID=59799 RepID=A0A7G2CMS9_9TRYP|nr:acyl-CoA binding protein [Angomonas deanei]CAD2220377.1 Acyl CoA binding protein, putative [Angomonas deanei]|eukprot:EPY26238.1 acyl-CoA binding protein [Angomonas deanei]
MLEDPLAVPEDEENDAVVDYWQPTYLALQLQQQEVLDTLVRFHTSHAESAIRTLVRQTVVEESSLGPAGTQEEDDSGGSPPLSPVQVELITCEVRSDWGGSVLLLGQYQPPPCHTHVDPNGTRRSIQVESEETLAAAQHRGSRLMELEEEFFSECEGFCITQVLTFLQPLLMQVVEDWKAKGEDGKNDTFALRFVTDHCASFVDMLLRPTVLIESSVLYDLCNGDFTCLMEVLELFQGSLTPIFRGKKFPDPTETNRSALVSISASPMNPSLSTPVSTPRGASTGRHSSTGGGVRHTPFWFTCPPQDAQRVAFYATWMTFREQASEKPGSARLRRAADIINEYRVTLNSHKKMRDARFIPAAAIWSGHMFIISKLISRDCSVEDFMDIVGEGAYLSVLSSNGIPGVMVAVLAACIVAQREIMAGKSNALRLLSKKVETLLHEAPNRPSPLRTYIMTPITSHAERFEELWLGDTCYFGAKKFKTRVEMLFCCTVELVLATAEQRWPADVPTATEEEDLNKVPPLMASLRMWILTWKTFFFNVRDRPLSAVHRRTLSRTSVGLLAPPVQSSSRSSPEMDRTRGSPSLRPRDPPAPLQDEPNLNLNDTTTNNNNAPGSEEVNEQQEAIKNVCEMLPLRLEHGRPPLQWLSGNLFPVASPPLDETSSNMENSLRGSSKATSIDSEFQTAQENFAKLYANNASNEVKLKFYGLFKQATVGDVNIPKPWLMDQVGRAKWDSWDKLKGMNTVDAKRMYVTEYKILCQIGDKS